MIVAPVSPPKGFQDLPDFRFGMNAPGNDDKQFVLNTLHWLSGSLH